MADVTELKNIKIDDLNPYENNSKIHGQKQIDKLAKSIEQFGFLSPILIDKDNNIIAGHGRTMAAKQLGLEEVPCVCVDGLTEDERKAYVIADNRLSELDSKWNMKIVAKELAGIKGIDKDLIKGLKMPELKPNGAERLRTHNAYNLDIARRCDATDDFWQMPMIRNEGYIPRDLIGFNYAKTNKDKNVGVHFYIDDYQFERVWNDPEKYLSILWDYECILTPDFSLYMDMPMPMKIWNVYRSRQIGAFYQSKGLTVIPTISWAEDATFEFCFAGIEKGSVVSVSTIGVKKEDDHFETWKNGMDEMIRRIEPSAILVYGGALDYDYGDIDVRYYNNKVTERWK